MAHARSTAAKVSMDGKLETDRGKSKTIHFLIYDLGQTDSAVAAS